LLCKECAAVIKTVFCFFYVIFAMLVLTPVGLVVVVLSLVGLGKPMSAMMHRIAQGWGRLFIAIMGCKLTVTGRENIPASGGVCFASNHGSIFDIVVLLAYVGRPFGFIAKKELLFIPFLNMWIAIMGGLFIDRKNPRNALKTINAGVARIKAGGGMIIFPEGHRSRGQGLLPFRPGAFKLATQAQSPIVPIAIAGTYDIFEKNGRANAAPVHMAFCPPISTSDIPSADRKLMLSDKVYEVIKGALGG
jgi:1-acyl-sn-glycerol-3-phosphate acyltransferase